MQKLLAFRLKHKLAAKMRIQGSHKPCTTSVQQLQQPQTKLVVGASSSAIATSGKEMVKCTWWQNIGKD